MIQLVPFSTQHAVQYTAIHWAEIHAMLVILTRASLKSLQLPTQANTSLCPAWHCCCELYAQANWNSYFLVDGWGGGRWCRLHSALQCTKPECYVLIFAFSHLCFTHFFFCCFGASCWLFHFWRTFCSFVDHFPDQNHSQWQANLQHEFNTVLKRSQLVPTRTHSKTSWKIIMICYGLVW